MTCRSSLPDPRLPRSLATAPWASTRCRMPHCSYLAVVDDLCSSCALLSLEYNEREAATVVGWELDRREAAAERTAGFRFSSQPGRMDAGVADLGGEEDAVDRWWRRFCREAGMSGEAAPKTARSNAEAAASATAEEPVTFPCPAGCGQVSAGAGFCGECLPKKQLEWQQRQDRFAEAQALLAAQPERPTPAAPVAVAPSQPRVDAGVNHVPESSSGSVVRLLLTLLGIAVVAKVVLTW